MAWIDGFFENSWMRIARHNSTTGALEVNGAAIPFESVAYTAFMDAGFDVATSRFVHVNDKHSAIDSAITAGSLWKIDPAAGSTRKRVLVSAPIYCTNAAAAPAAASHPGLEIFDAGLGPNGCYKYSDGTGYLVKPGSVIKRTTVRENSLVVPAATFGSANATNSGGFVQLVGAGVHGLTQAVCVTAGVSYLWVTGGTAGLAVGFHQIRTITDGGGTLLLQTAYTIDGTVTTVQAGTTDVVLQTITLPRLAANSKVTVNATTFHPNTANNKKLKLKLSGTTLFTPDYNSTLVGLSNFASWSFYNRASVSSQVASLGNLSPYGLGLSSQACNTAAIDTSTGSATLTLSYALATANEVCGIEAFEVVVS